MDKRNFREDCRYDTFTFHFFLGFWDTLVCVSLCLSVCMCVSVPLFLLSASSIWFAAYPTPLSLAVSRCLFLCLSVSLCLSHCLCLSVCLSLIRVLAPLSYSGVTVCGRSIIDRTGDALLRGDSKMTK